MKKIIIISMALAAAGFGLFALFEEAQAQVKRNCPQVDTSLGTVSYVVNVPVEGTYTVWSRMKAGSSTNNSFWFQMDDSCPQIVGDNDQISTSEWTWVNYINASASNAMKVYMYITTDPVNIDFTADHDSDGHTVYLTKGTHTFKITGREKGVAVDKFIFTLSDTCTPVGLGTNCDLVAPTASPVQTSPSPVVPNPTSQPSVNPTQAPSSGGVTLYPTDDTFIRTGYPDTNYGSDDELQVDGSPPKITYIKFDLRSLGERNIEEATLMLRTTDNSSSTQTVKISDNNSWTEKTITYNNKPGGTEKVVGSISNVKSGEWVEIDLTQVVRENQDGLLTIIMDSSGGNGVDFNSKEASKEKPHLLIK